MWLSKEHFNLIRERAAEFRAWHEERMRDKEAVIASLQMRVSNLEDERTQLTERLWTREEERTKVPEAVPEQDGWEAEMWRQIGQLDANEAEKSPLA